MDSLRGPWNEAADSGFEGAEFPYTSGDPADDFLDEIDADIDAEPPPTLIGQDERRMQVRAYNLWASMLDDRAFPTVSDLDLSELRDFQPNSVMLDFSRGIDNPRIAFLGEKLAEECGVEAPIRRLSDIPGRSLLSRITDHYMQILANAAPIGFEAEFVNQRDCTILYRGILLPFSDDGVAIGQILGVINWKELVDQQTTDALLLEIDQALRAAPPATARRIVSTAPGTLTPTPMIAAMPPMDAQAAAPARIAWPEPAFGETDFCPPAVPEATRVPPIVADETPPGGLPLSQYLASARELAIAARVADARSHQALYAAIGRAHDFALAAAAAPADYAALLTEAGLTAQTRAPLTPLVKLVFGADADKTRLTEYAAALAHAARLHVGVGGLAEYLAAQPGGLKAVVAAERAARAGDGPAKLPRIAPRAGLARALRALTPVPLAALTGKGAEFTLLVVRRGADGALCVLGEVAGELPVLERAARQLVGPPSLRA